MPNGASADAAHRAFLAAEIRFYEGEFDDAQPAYQAVAENFTRTRKTNDAVGRYLQIARAKDQGDLEALKVYATMEKFNRMADSTATWNAATALLTKFATSDLAADAMVRQAEILRAKPGQSEDAIALCAKAVEVALDGHRLAVEFILFLPAGLAPQTGAEHDVASGDDQILPIFGLFALLTIRSILRSGAHHTPGEAASGKQNGERDQTE